MGTEEKVVIVPAVRWDEADEWAATIGAEHHLPVDMNLALAYQTLKLENARLHLALRRIQDDPTNARQVAAVALRP